MFFHVQRTLSWSFIYNKLTWSSKIVLPPILNVARTCFLTWSINSMRNISLNDFLSGIIFLLLPSRFLSISKNIILCKRNYYNVALQVYLNDFLSGIIFLLLPSRFLSISKNIILCKRNYYNVALQVRSGKMVYWNKWYIKTLIYTLKT